MKTISLILIAAIIAGCSSCPNVVIMRENDFVVMPEFRGSVIAVQKLEWPPGFHPTSLPSGHYRITIKKTDGNGLIVERVETSVGLESTVTNSLGKENLNLPNDLYGKYLEAKREHSQQSD